MDDKKMDKAYHQNPNNPTVLKTSSNRSVGFVFTIFFTLVGLWPYPQHGYFRAWAFYVAAALLIVSLVKPKLLTPINRFWTALGLVLHKIISPVILGIIFWGIFTPIGSVMRMLGKDFLNLNLGSKQNSYWIKRNPPGPAPDTMSNQF